MDYSVEQEFKKVWGSLRCKANCNSVGGLTSGQLYKTTTLGSTYLKIVP